LAGESMNRRGAIIATLAVALLVGVINAHFEALQVDVPKPITLVLSASLMVTAYLWYRRDSAARNYRGSVYLGGAIALFFVVTVPYYLYRSRQAGARRSALLRYLGLCFAYLVFSGLGWVAYESLVTG
jgi:hypothetical protein